MRGQKRSTILLAWAAALILLAFFFAGCSGSARHQTGSSSEEIAVGARLGKAAGATSTGNQYIIDYMNKQADDLDVVGSLRIERYGDQIRVVWRSSDLFDLDSAMLKLESRERINSLADVLQEFPDTEIAIIGHTDNTAPSDYSQKLSERQAISVKNYLADRGVGEGRISAMGFGASSPVADNTTEDGRQENRRIVIEIRANDTLKARALVRSEEE